MIDFSFLNENDIITIDNDLELVTILLEFEKADICCANSAIAAIKKATVDPIRYIRIDHIKGDYCLRFGTRDASTFAQAYTVSEVLQLGYREPLDSDLEPLDESALYEYLCV